MRDFSGFPEENPRTFGQKRGLLGSLQISRRNEKIFLFSSPTSKKSPFFCPHRSGGLKVNFHENGGPEFAGTFLNPHENGGARKDAKPETSGTSIHGKYLDSKPLHFKAILSVS